MKMETCIFFAPNKNKRNCCSFNPHTSHGRRSALTPTLVMVGGQFSLTYILVLYLCRQILVAYKLLYCFNSNYIICTSV